MVSNPRICSVVNSLVKARLAVLFDDSRLDFESSCFATGFHRDIGATRRSCARAVPTGDHSAYGMQARLPALRGRGRWVDRMEMLKLVGDGRAELFGGEGFGA